MSDHAALAPAMDDKVLDELRAIAAELNEKTDMMNKAVGKAEAFLQEIRLGLEMSVKGADNQWLAFARHGEKFRIGFMSSGDVRFTSFHECRREVKFAIFPLLPELMLAILDKAKRLN